ncbi:MAG: phosphopeptide-binding protein [Bacteroidota bacterium]
MRFLSSLLLLFFLASCGGPKEDKNTTEIETPTESNNTEVGLTWEKNGIKVYEALVEEEFQEASIELVSPTVPSSGPTTFKFDVKNYDLGAQTSDADIRNCANSGKGQHIHFIVNNQPYLAHYTDSFEVDMPEGTNVVLAFLSRSYHESIKTSDAHTVIKYGMGGQDMKEPLLFYSRPKGTYAGNDGKKLLLDFYLKNISLSEKGYQVRATIDGETFMLPKWCPYFVEGLGVGEHSFQIELLDDQGNPVSNFTTEDGMKSVGSFSNSGERIVTITAG